MEVYEKKKYFEAQINNQYICFKNNTKPLFFVLARSELGWIFFSTPVSDIYRFPELHMAEIYFLLESL